MLLEFTKGPYSLKQSKIEKDIAILASEGEQVYIIAECYHQTAKDRFEPVAANAALFAAAPDLYDACETLLCLIENECPHWNFYEQEVARRALKKATETI